MYHWYQESGICYAYLEDVPKKREFSGSKWFTRGWTLQELIAPARLVFLNRNWKEVGDKVHLQQTVSDCTGIPVGILAGTDNLESFSIAQRMSWASERETSRIEDRAYSLMGIFGINMPLIYGERERAFIRLQEEILRVSDDLSLFAWRSGQGNGLLARSPAAFVDSRNIIRCNQFQSLNPPTVSSKGVHLEVHFVGVGRGGLGLAILECQERDRANTLIALYVRDIYMTMQMFTRVSTTNLEQVDMRYFEKSQYPIRKICIEAHRLAHSQKPKPGGRSVFHPEIFFDFRLPNWGGGLFMDAYKEASRAAWEGDDGLLWALMTRADVEAASKSATFCLHRSKDYAWCKGSDRITRRKTPLSLAVERGHTSTVEMLLDRGATAEAIKGSETTLLKLAVRSGNCLTVRLIADKGMMMNVSYGEYVKILDEAAGQRNESVLLELTRLGQFISPENATKIPLKLVIKQWLLSIDGYLSGRGWAVEARDQSRYRMLWRARGVNRVMVF